MHEKQEGGMFTDMGGGGSIDRDDPKRVKKLWAKVRLAVQLGSIVGSTVDTMHRKKRAAEEIKELEEMEIVAEQAVLNEIKEAAEAERVAEKKSLALEARLKELEVEQAEVDEAGRQRDAARALHDEAETLHAAAVANLETAGGRIKLVKVDGVKSADVGGKSDPYCLVKWNGKIIDRTEVLKDQEDPVFSHTVKFDMPGGKRTVVSPAMLGHCLATRTHPDHILGGCGGRDRARQAERAEGRALGLRPHLPIRGSARGSARRGGRRRG